MSEQELQSKIREFEAETRKLKSNLTRVTHEIKDLDLRIKENKEKLTMSTVLPHMVANVGEILDNDEEDEERDGSGFN
jgi:26S proteasome regulatory subunit T5